MSCWMLSNKSKSMLADYIASVLNAGFNYHGIDAPDDLRTALNDCVVCGYYEPSKVFEHLTDLNSHAYKERYRETPDGETDIYKAQPRFTEYREYNGQHEIIKPWHYQILKRIECFLYQCKEGDTPNELLFKGLEQLESKLMHYIVQNSQEWHDAAWE